MRLTDLVCAAVATKTRITAVARDVGLLLRDTAHIIRHLHELKEIIVAQFDQFNETAGNLTEAVNSLKARVAEDFDNLKAQLAQAGVAQDTIDSATAKMQATVEALQSFDPDPSFPAAPVEPSPEQPQV